MNTSFQDEYAGLSDEELLKIAGDRRDLLEEAAFALDGEMIRRGLTYEQATQAKVEIERLGAREETARKVRSRRNSAEKLNMLLAMIVVAAVVGLYLLIVPKQFQLADEWDEPAIIALLGAAFAVSGVRPKTRKQLIFWLALLPSAAIQVLVAHWLLLRFPNPSRGTGKLIWMASLLAGGAVGLAAYRLCRICSSRSKES